MTTLIELNDDLAALYTKGDMAAFAERYDEDAILSAPDGVFAGRPAIQASWERTKRAFPDSTVDMIREAQDGDTVFGEWRWTGTNTGVLTMPDGTELAPTGRRVEMQGAEIVRFRDGVVVEHRLYFDNMAMLEQLGLLPAT